MANPGMQRREIEDNIVTLARKVDTRDARWLDGELFSDFIDAWHTLAHYYERSQDTTLDAHVLKTYMRYAVTLRHVFEDERLSKRRRVQAMASLNDLNNEVDGVFRQIERNGGARAAV
jgi:hypothetical protein